MPRRIKFKFFILLFSLFLLDRLTKKFFLANPNFYCQKFLCLQLSKNKNLFFLPINQTLVIIFSLLIIFFLITWFFKSLRSKNYLKLIGQSLLILGGISNLYDRLFHGFVIDFISTSLWPFSIFNLADIMVATGVVFLVLSIK